MDKILCKKCSSDSIVMNGKVRFQQRYKCKSCGCNFIVGDKREKLSPAARSLAILLYGRGKASYGFIAKLLKVSSVAIMKLIKREADKLPDPVIDSSIKEVSFDEMWHFVEQKKQVMGLEGSGAHSKSDYWMVCRVSFYCDIQKVFQKVQALKRYFLYR
jgi:transposase